MGSPKRATISCEQIWWHDGVGRQTVARIGIGEYPDQEVTGGGVAGTSGRPGGAPNKVVGALARREVVRWLRATSVRYQPVSDWNVELRAATLVLAGRRRQYGAGMIYLKLRQQGVWVNHKRVERLYVEAQLQLRRRTRKKVPMGVRQPLVRPESANQVWSMDFVFDRSAEGRVIKCLTIV
ncbi:MAG: transposase, partial [Nitrospira sp.]|nr:transposase [Nitrospira sp.]